MIGRLLHRCVRACVLSKGWALTPLLCCALSVAYADLPPKPIAFMPLQPKLSTQPIRVPGPPKLTPKAYLLLDHKSGVILAQKNIHDRIEPASLTKMMTLYVAFYAIEQGQVHLNDTVRISKHAWRAVGSRMFLRVGHDVALQLLLQGVVVDSGNDACIALAEYIAGSEQAFVTLMNQTAEQLGMAHTHFSNVTGMPDPKHYTTAYDLARLAQALIEHYPQHYHWFKQRYLRYNKIKQSNRNHLLWQNLNVDGLKTGHTQNAGYCLVASAKHDQMRLISVVIGAKTAVQRLQASRTLLNYGFRFYHTQKMFTAQTPLIKAHVWLGKKNTLQLGLTDDWYMTHPKAEFKQLQTKITLNKPIKAPVQKGRPYGTLTIKRGKKIIDTRPLVALTTIPLGHAWHRFIDHIRLLWQG